MSRSASRLKWQRSRARCRLLQHGLQMEANSRTPVRFVKLRNTEIVAGDTRERYREKIARITPDSTVQFVGLPDAKGTVLEINQVALDASELNSPTSRESARQRQP